MRIELAHSPTALPEDGAGSFGDSPRRKWVLQVRRRRPFYKSMHVSSTSAASSSTAAREARETPAQTRQEAANGQPHAIRKLGGNKAAQAPVNPSPPGTGQLVKVTA
jgi:hypothetical protein